jgi:hypothetical protein
VFRNILYTFLTCRKLCSALWRALLLYTFGFTVWWSLAQVNDRL